MKKVTKTLSLVALCAVMIIMSVVPAFAESGYVEDHSVVDCTHYYKQNGYYYFQIKCPKGELNKVTLALTSKSDGTVGYGGLPFKYDSLFTSIFSKEHAYSDELYDYTWFVAKCSDYPERVFSQWGGFGIKIFYYDDNGNKMATNNANGSTEQGCGYWLSA